MLAVAGDVLNALAPVGAEHRVGCWPREHLDRVAATDLDALAVLVHVGGAVVLQADDEPAVAPEVAVERLGGRDRVGAAPLTVAEPLDTARAEHRVDLGARVLDVEPAVVAGVHPDTAAGGADDRSGMLVGVGGDPAVQRYRVRAGDCWLGIAVGGQGELTITDQR